MPSSWTTNPPPAHVAILEQWDKEGAYWMERQRKSTKKNSSTSKKVNKCKIFGRLKTHRVWSIQQKTKSISTNKRFKEKELQQKISGLALPEKYHLTIWLSDLYIILSHSKTPRISGLIVRFNRELKARPYAKIVGLSYYIINPESDSFAANFEDAVQTHKQLWVLVFALGNV